MKNIKGRVILVALRERERESSNLENEKRGEANG